jgi:hypothetical protein
MKVFFRLFVSVAVLAIAQSITFAQGAMVGFTCTDLDNDGATDHQCYRIDLTAPGATVPVGRTGVVQEIEGLFSVDGAATSRLFGVAENPDISSPGLPSILVDLTAAANGGTGTQIGSMTGITFGTEAGSAYDHINGVAYSVASDDLALAQGSRLYTINISNGTATQLSTTPGVYIDGLAFGANGILYGSDARITDSLYRYNFDTNRFVLVGSFGVSLNEDSGLANYRGVDGTGTSLFMITEGDGAANVGRLWSVSISGPATPIGELRLAGSNLEVPEDLEGFDIPWRPTM